MRAKLHARGRGKVSVSVSARGRALARGAAVFRRLGTKRVTVKLTRTGRLLLQQARRRTRVGVTVAFQAPGRPRISKRAYVTLRR